MPEKRTVVVTVRLPESIGDAAKRLAERDRRKLSSFLALMIEDGVRALLEAEKADSKGKARK
jgi:hypothetical protein